MLLLRSRVLSDTIDSWVRAALIGHSILASTPIVLHIVYILWVPGGCHEFAWELSHVSCWVWQFMFLLRVRPSSMVSSSRNVQYGCRTCGISLILLGHPNIIVCFSSASSSSAWVACQISCKLLLLAGSWCEIWYTCSFGSLIVSSWSPNLDRQSASRFFGPGMYLTVKLYGKVLIKMHCSCRVAWLRLLESIASSGFWSVLSMKWHPYRKWWNFSIAQATVRDSISMAMYPLCVSVRALLAKYIGFSSCNRQAPRPLVLPSVCSTVSFQGL